MITVYAPIISSIIEFSARLKFPAASRDKIHV
jgi:hypothetical protein